MTCDGFRDRVFDYLDGSLQDRAEFRDHFAACASCASILRGIEENEKTLALARVPVAPPDAWPAIARAISAARPVPFRARRWAAVGAAAALLLGLASLFFSAPPGPNLDVVIEEVQADADTLRMLVPAYDELDPLAASGRHP